MPVYLVEGPAASGGGRVTASVWGLLQRMTSLCSRGYGYVGMVYTPSLCSRGYGYAGMGYTPIVTPPVPQVTPPVGPERGLGSAVQG